LQEAQEGQKTNNLLRRSTREWRKFYFVWRNCIKFKTNLATNFAQFF